VGSVMFRNNCVLLQDQDRRSSTSTKTAADAAKDAEVKVEKTVHAAIRAEREAEAAKNETHTKEAELAAEQAKVAVLASQKALEVANRLVALVEVAAEEVENREIAGNDVSASPEIAEPTTHTSEITLQGSSAAAREVAALVQKAVKEAKSPKEFAEGTQTAINLTLRFAKLAPSKTETKAAKDSEKVAQDAVKAVTEAVSILVKQMHQKKQKQQQ